MSLILHADASVIVAAKPAGLVTHPTRQCSDRASLMTILRNTLGHWVFPVHRLDRATSGVVIFGATSEAAAHLSRSLSEHQMNKRYLAVLRGHLHGEGIIDKPLPKTDSSTLQPAITRWRALAHTEQPWPVRPYQTARYTLAELEPVTGRTHQLRKHLRALSHPIIGDRRFGDGAHNRMLAERTGVDRLLLHAQSLSFPHPQTAQLQSFEAPLDGAFREILALFGKWVLPASGDTTNCAQHL